MNIQKKKSFLFFVVPSAETELHMNWRQVAFLSKAVSKISNLELVLQCNVVASL
jgi:hypothetical protein